MFQVRPRWPIRLALAYACFPVGLVQHGSIQNKVVRCSQIDSRTPLSSRHQP